AALDLELEAAGLARTPNLGEVLSAAGGQVGMAAGVRQHPVEDGLDRGRTVPVHAVFAAAIEQVEGVDPGFAATLKEGFAATLALGRTRRKVGEDLLRLGRFTASAGVGVALKPRLSGDQFPRLAMRNAAFGLDRFGEALDAVERRR